MYIQTESTMTMWYFTLGMMHARYPYNCPLADWVDFSMVNTPPSLFLRVLMDLGAVIPVIFDIASFLGDKYFVHSILGHF